MSLAMGTGEIPDLPMVTPGGHMEELIRTQIFVDSVTPKKTMKLEQLHCKLLDNVNSLNVSRLLPLQSALIPQILEKKDIVTATESGTGKTFGYIMAAIQHLLHNPRADNHTTPRVLIIAPSHEVADEAHSITQRLCYNTSLVCAIAIGGTANPVHEIPPCDILVGTAGKLMDFLLRGSTAFHHLELMIFDHANNLFREPGMRSHVKEMFDGILHHNKAFARILISTEEGYGGWKDLTTPYINPDNLIIISAEHPPRFIHAAWTESTIADRDQDLINAIRRYDKVIAPEKVLVFTATIKQAEMTGEILADAFPNWVVAVTHSKIPGQERQRLHNGFSRSAVKVLICCKVFLHGLNVDGCELVIYREPSYDQRYFLSGLGRTGKRGQEGVVSVLFDPNDPVESARKPIHENALNPSKDGHRALPLIDPAGEPSLKSKPPSTRLFIGNIPHALSDQQCKEFFARYGAIGVERTWNKRIKKPTGVAFVQFESIPTATKGLEQLQGCCLGDRLIRASFCGEKGVKAEGGGRKRKCPREGGEQKVAKVDKNNDHPNTLPQKLHK